jgi:Fe2+ transport system protein FeoA
LKLSELRGGAKVTGVITNCDCVIRIMTLGIIEGCELKYLSSTGNNIEFSLYGKRIVISKHCAEQVIINVH